MKSLQGHLLVATPQLRDPNFVETVLLMIQHTEEGALGLILNRPTNTTIGNAWNQVSDKPCDCEEPLHHGGPCEGPLMVVHLHEPVSQIEVSSEIYFSAEKENVEWLIEQNERPIKFFVGCAGWEPGQLESELETGSWLTLPAAFRHIFSNDEDQWTSVTQEIARLTTFPTLDPRLIPRDPSLN